MSSSENDPGERETGIQSASDKSTTSNPTLDADHTEIMKRAAAKLLIERYYYQLTDGCGQAQCNNTSCASCSHFLYTDISKNTAALRAIELFKEKATLCESSPSKQAKSDDTYDSKSSIPSTSQQPGTSSQQTAKPKACVRYLTEDKLSAIITVCEAEQNWAQLIRILGEVYSSPECLLQSFLQMPAEVSKEDIRAMETDKDKDCDEHAMDTDGSTASDCLTPDNDTVCSARSPLPGPSSSQTTCAKSKAYLNAGCDKSSLDLDSVRRAYNQLFAIPDLPFQAALINALIYLSRTLSMELRYHQAFERDPNYLNIFLIVMEIPVLHSPELIESATPLFCQALGSLPLRGQVELARMWSKFPEHHLKQFVDSLQQLITVKVISSQWQRVCVHDDDGITGATRVLKILYYASVLGGTHDSEEVREAERLSSKSVQDNLQELLQVAGGHDKDRTIPKPDPFQVEIKIRPIDCRQPVIQWDDFINEPLSDQIEMDKDYANYRNEKEDKFSFMNHSFILTTAAKNLGMYYENRIHMINERRASLLQSLLRGASTTPYLRLRIRRDHIIDDALVALEMVAMDNPIDLKKQLYVEFEGEQGIDEGGVSKEFFQLVVEELFNPDIGMFVHDEETATFKFNPTSFENDGQFTLIGIVLGLAIYNNIILDVHFPEVVYRKLMGKHGNFNDLKESHPTLARGLQQLLEFEGDVEDTFMQTFTISYKDVFGSVLDHNLKGEDSAPVTVTNANRQEFVDLYADFLLNKCIDKQFVAFQRGFQMVTDESPLKMLFRPEEVELLVCGSKQFDFNALEEATDYDGGFSVDSPTIRHFWELVHEFTDDQKRQLLAFTTGSDRVPVGGLSKLKLIIARNGPDSDRLPTSHTCFNVLLLPDYANKDKLQERILKAITHAKGFGML